VAETPKVNDPAKTAERTKESLNKIPAHAPEQVVTRDTSPSVERPGHETEHPDRKEGN